MPFTVFLWVKNVIKGTLSQDTPGMPRRMRDVIRSRQRPSVLEDLEVLWTREGEGKQFQQSLDPVLGVEESK
jgi:hypothetical protein